jgi:hypothetical protein
MNFLITLICAVIGFGAVWAFLKIVWEPGNTESLKMKAYIRDLEWQTKKLDAGINPDGMPFDYDHSSDYHNLGCDCEQCKRINPVNEARVARDAAKLKLLREASND